MDISFCNLRCKDVVNVCDGKNLGNITDIIIDTCCGRVLGIVVPSSKSFFSFFKSNNDIFIPYNRICKIGKDIILVDIFMQNSCEIQNSKIQNQTNENIELNDFNKKPTNIQSLLNELNK